MWRPSGGGGAVVVAHARAGVEEGVAGKGAAAVAAPALRRGGESKSSSRCGRVWRITRVSAGCVVWLLLPLLFLLFFVIVPFVFLLMLLHWIVVAVVCSKMSSFCFLLIYYFSIFHLTRVDNRHRPPQEVIRGKDVP